MATAMDEILNKHLTKVVAKVKIVEPTNHYSNTEVFVDGHPLPSEEGVRTSPKYSNSHFWFPDS